MLGAYSVVPKTYKFEGQSLMMIFILFSPIIICFLWFLLEQMSDRLMPWLLKEKHSRRPSFSSSSQVDSQLTQESSSD